MGPAGVMWQKLKGGKEIPSEVKSRVKYSPPYFTLRS